MAGLFFSRKSKNGVGMPDEAATVTPNVETLYDPLPAPALMDEPPDAIPGIPDLYGVLGVDPRASDDVIRYAYRRKAAKLHDARWRPGRAARQLAELNAAYEILGKPDRRTDYDRQRARMYYYQRATQQEQMLGDPGVVASANTAPTRQPRKTSSGWRAPRPPRGLVEAVAIVGVVVVAFYAGYTVLGNSSVVDLTGLQDAGAAMGLPIRPRSSPTAGTTTTGQAPAVATQPSPTPRQVIVPAVGVPSPTPAPAAVAAPTAAPAPPTFAVRVSNPAPPRRTEISIIVRLTHDGRPIQGAPVYVVAKYKTVEERFPENNGTVQTNVNGDATITFNIGDATAGHPVSVDVIGMVENDKVQAQTTFTPR